MSEVREVVVLSGVRTAIGDYGGALKDIAPTELGGQVIREAVKRAKIDAAQVNQLVFGNVIHTEAKDMYLSRVAAIKGGLPQDATALTVNRLCGSGLQAIVSAAQGIQLGDADIAVGGGAESMSRAAYVMPSLRWGARMADSNVVDMMVGALTDPFDTVHMGITAENIADKWKITRDQQDEFAVESHRRAINAIEKGYFKDQILPIELKTRKGTTLFERDEHARADAALLGGGSELGLSQLDLGALVEDLDVPVLAEPGGGFADEMGEQVHAQRGVAGLKHGEAPGDGGVDVGLAGVEDPTVVDELDVAGGERHRHVEGGVVGQRLEHLHRLHLRRIRHAVRLQPCKGFNHQRVFNRSLCFSQVPSQLSIIRR